MPDATVVCNVHQWRETYILTDNQINDMDFLQRIGQCPGCERDRRLAKMIAEETVKAQNAAKTV